MPRRFSVRPAPPAAGSAGPAIPTALPAGRSLPAARSFGQTALAGLLCLAVLTALPGLVLAAGMDCAKAKTPVELRICADPALVAADKSVAEAFAAAVAAGIDVELPRMRAIAQRANIRAE